MKDKIKYNMIHPYFYEYCTHCANLDFSLGLISYKQIRIKTIWYKRLKYDVVRGLLEEKLMQYANAEKLIPIPIKYIDDNVIGTVKEWQVLWYNNIESNFLKKQTKIFSTQHKAKLFSRELRLASKTIGKSRPKIEVLLVKK